mgnify:FL=1|tara:strand:- start:909 stop:1163 length:255 start_codon:yes stop_codon:yes gene_type:complete
MVYTTKEIDKVLSYKTWSTQRKVDELLRNDCRMYCNLGSDSTVKEKTEVKKMSRKIYVAIKTLNKNMGVLFLQSMDSKLTTEPL